MFTPHTYRASVDPNDPSRAFADYLQVQIDYRSPFLRDGH